MAARNLGTTVTGGRRPETPPGGDKFLLHIVFPPALRRTVALGTGETAIGRDPGLDGVLVDDGTISRQHATLTWSAAQRRHAVRDLGSRNGTWVDGVPVKDAPRTLVGGSLLRLGDTLLVYEEDVAAASDGAAVSRDDVPGEAAGMRRLRALLARVAADPAPVLILGETGTGKERIARELHRLSGRSGKLVALNCAALNTQLAESQLFGHLRGAFTGATEAQPGLFRAAHGGTLFLDEIGELPAALQPKLLRALQEGEVLPVGATQATRVDVRVVAATHRDLERAVTDGSFREDLYARLALAELAVPPLRDRRVDLLGWIERLGAAWAEKRGRETPLRFDADAAEALLRFAWPLNLRGIERLVHDLGAEGPASDVVTRGALPGWLTAAGGEAPAAETTTVMPPAASAQPPARDREAVPTREEFTRAFHELEGSVHGLAKRFGRDRRQIYRWIEAHELAADRAGRKADRDP
jgi:transcriptional regulator with GAF, ATPase, and Fis domain